MIFFDTHCHFDFEVFDADRNSVWQDCLAQGIRSVIVPSVSPAQWRTAADLANAYRGIYYAAGLHPWWIAQELQSKNLTAYLIELKHRLRTQITSDKCVAVGECGVDAMIDLPIDIQTKICDVHLQVAQDQQKPLILHCRKAHNDLLPMLKSYHLSAGGVVHGFSGSYELAMQYWALGFRLGIGGTITYERANKTRDAVRRLPLESILLETDAPDMPLHGKQGARNSPVYLTNIANTLAELRGESLTHIAQQTTLNAHLLFKTHD